MRTLEFSVKSQKLRRASSSSFSNIVRGSKNFLKAIFSFSDEWASMNKVVLFSTDKCKEYVALRNNECMIPDKITESLVFKVRVIGVNGDQKVSTTELTIRQEDA